MIVITGPTATGKTAVGIQLAKLLDGEVVSADSMQVYKHMDIGTAKPTKDEMLAVPHHLYDFVEPSVNYSAARYISDASACINDILSHGKVPILVGGTGLYIESLLSGREFSVRASSEQRKRLEDEYDRIGGEEMHRRLREFDFDAAERLHFNDKRRIVRAFEIFQTTGKTITEHDFETKALPPRYNALKIALTFANRAVLYKRIDDRVDMMMSDGLVREVQALLGMGISPGVTSMQAIGYKEIVLALEGDTTMDEAVEKIKMESRRYAKRQLSWLRRDENVQWVTWDKIPMPENCARRIAAQYEANR